MNFKGNENKFEIGKMFWICDFRLNQSKGADKPIRHVKPTYAEVVDNCELPRNKKVYYSNVHFRPINKKGKRLSNVIPPFDNTGYRSFTGVALNVFEFECDCINFYKKQCAEAMDILEEEKRDRAIFYEEKISEIRSLYREY